MSDGGVSLGQVRSEIRSHIAPLERDIRVLDQRLDQLERDMANIEGAVREMHRGLQGELNQLRTTNNQLLEVQHQTKQITLEQFVAANTQLTHANVQRSTTNTSLGVINDTSARGFQTLDVGIDRMAQAIVQTEVIRLLYEAKEPTERVGAFATEIEERFTKTVENVFMVRSQYDQLLTVAANEYDSKLRVIGEHIFGIFEGDFQQAAETPLSVPSGRSVELPLALDELRLSERRAALESRFDKLGDAVIEPVLEAHRRIEHSLATQFLSQVAPTGEELALPSALRVSSDGEFEILGSVHVKSEASSDGGTRLTLEPCGDPGLQAAVAARIRPLARKLKATELSSNQLERLKESLRALGASGRIDETLVAALCHYLDIHGLAIIAQQEVSST